MTFFLSAVRIRFVDGLGVLGQLVHYEINDKSSYV
jgi:hypothetical protein